MRKLILFLFLVFIGLAAGAQIREAANNQTISSISITDTINVSAVDTTLVMEVSPAAGGYPNAIWHIGAEAGNVSYTSSTSVTISSSPVTITKDAQLVSLTYARSGASGIYTNGQNGIVLTHSGGVVTITGAVGDTVASGDSFVLSVNGPRHGFNYTTGNWMYELQNPDWSRYTDPVAFQTENDTCTTSWTDFGNEIDCRGYTDGIIYLSIDIEASNDVRIRALGKKSSGGTFEGNLLIETVSSTDIKVQKEYVEFNEDIDQEVILRVHAGGIPFIQFQKQIGTDGGADAFFVGPSDYNLIWR